MSNSYFSICSFFYILLLTFVYFSKRSKKNKIEKVYGGLIITNLLGLIVAVACFFTVENYEQIPIINYIVSRLYLVYLIPNALKAASTGSEYTSKLNFEIKSAGTFEYCIMSATGISIRLAPAS